MITSDKQYAAAKEQLAMLTASLSSQKRKGVPDLIENAGKWVPCIFVRKYGLRNKEQSE